MNAWLRMVLWVLVIGIPPFRQADAAVVLRIAVATNFRAPLTALSEVFGAETGMAVRASSGSTGKLYAQIRHGAPFDLFLAADSQRPVLLEESGLAIRGSRRTYAIGRLVLWSRDPALVQTNADVLVTGDYRHLAIANPDTAPYGRAAQEVLQRLGLHQRMGDRLVIASNIGQAFQFVASGNAQLGLVALVQANTPRFRGTGSHFLIPQDWHQPIIQQLVVLDNGRVTKAQRFVDFLDSDKAVAILDEYGYDRVTAH